MEQESKGLAIASMVLGIISLLLSCCYGGIIGIIALILGIVSLSKHRGGKGMAITGIVTSSIAIIITLFAILIGGMDTDKLKEQLESQTTEATTEEVTTETTTEATTEESTEIDVDELKANATEVTYEDIYRNPETWKNKELKIIVHVEKYESKFLGLVGTYHCTVDGQTLLLLDVRSVEEPTIASGDNVIIYGLGGGMATLTESQKNMIGITTDKEETKIPQINMYAAELQ